MKENIETKDVQRTEYLDKNGLDMLWAKVKENTHNQVEVERNRAVAKENSIIDTKADKSALDNYVLNTALAEYAKKTDIPEVDTSDFVSKTTTDVQTINSTLSLHDTLYISSSDDSSSDGEQHNVILNPEALQIMTGDLEGGDLVGVQITSAGRDPSIRLTDSAYTNTLKITREGIHNTDNNANHVYATNGTIADLTQYAKKSEISAGGNVDDVQVNSVSVVENKIANIKPATKESLGVVKVGDGLNVTDGTISVDSTAIGTGNHIPYREKWMDWYNLPYDASLKFQKNGSTPDSAIVRPGAIETMHYDTTNKINTTISIGGNENYYFKGIRLYTNGDNRVTLDDHSLTIFDGNGSNVYDVVKLNADGIKLHNGDNNHVLTSNASTIDITQYVLKSVYDEKIAALEARIAALEAKHTETA